MNGTAANRASRPVLLLIIALVIAALFFARAFLVPLALAVLISFLLAPLAGRLERWKIGRVASVITATALAFSMIGFVAFIMGGQLVDLAKRLPDYKTNLRTKAAALKTKPNSPFNRVVETVREVTEEITRNEPPSKDATSASSPMPVPVAVVDSPGAAMRA
ncbi:MAG TPA: AI-2E family transporter, partial [Chthoniobacteraceae bacterium]|nr:AI-2E family transporter [Chthoniobacteraceae bacterium]